MRPYLLAPSLCFSLLLLFVLACQQKEETAVNNKIKVAYQEYLCCGNLKAVDQAVDGPEGCLPFDLLFATNLASFNIPEQYDMGDTFTITYELLGDCDAGNSSYECYVICNNRHGMPIKILSIE